MAVRRTVLLAFAILVSGAGLGLAQQPPPPVQAALPQKKESAPPPKHKLGPLEISVNWRERVEGWDWFKGNSGNNEYPFWDSLLRVGIGQTSQKIDWFVEGEQVAILGLPNNAVVAAPQGQLGLGGTYYAANHNNTENANGFLKQAYVNFKHLGPAGLKIGRFEYFDGLEAKPADPLLATVVQTRISSRLISNFAFTAVQRTYDGVQLAFNSGPNNLTFFSARPTQGVFQVKGMDELDVDTYYGAYTRQVKTAHGAGELRVFGLGYVDHRTLVLKTDNRPQGVRAADHGLIQLATYGADYVHVFNTATAGKFDVLGWGVLQGGSWGTLAQRAGSFVGEAGWQPPMKALKPWISVGYSYGSGDGNANDSKHGTFFQVLTTPRQYARFPFYNMMNNEDAYATLNVRPVAKLALRSEVHALRLANSHDFWYQGGGAFQPGTFGYTGRPSSGNQGMANVADISADFPVTRSLSANVYYGHAWGKGVIASLYPKDTSGQLVYLETNFHF